MRQMTLKRRMMYALLGPMIKLVLYSLWASCRVTRIEGEQTFDKLHQEGQPFITCYWHQNHLFCSWYMRRLIRKGMQIGFLVSPSVDGEIPAKIVKSWGAAEVVRGSKSRSGAQTLRDMYQIIVKRGISLVTTSDGPRGPLHQFKVGDIVLSQFTQAPLVPVSYAANKYWQLNKAWDRFIIPKPFSRIVITVGEPQTVDKSLHTDDLEFFGKKMEQQLLNLNQRAHSLVN